MYQLLMQYFRNYCVTPKTIECAFGLQCLPACNIYDAGMRSLDSCIHLGIDFVRLACSHQSSALPIDNSHVVSSMPYTKAAVE